MKSKKQPTILLVDDDAMVASAIEHLLKLNGYRVLVARDGLEALRQHEANAESIHLLVTDLQMPNVNGPELVRRLRQICPDLPVIFMSGNPGADPSLSLAAFPNHLFLQKPFAPSTLLAHLSSVLAS